MSPAIFLALQIAAATPPAVAPRSTANATPATVAAGARDAAPANGAHPEKAARAKRRIVVDAGHGGVDPGMSGPIGTKWKIREKHITLQVSRQLSAALRERGLDVVMTRTADTLIDLYDRGRIANERQGDLFISIHVNSANLRWKNPGAARGFETYFLAEAKTEDAKRVERMENESVRFETDAQATKNDPLNFIINDMAQNEHLRESSELASLIQARLGKVEPGPSRGVKQAGFIVLTTAYMPAVLVEIGFGSNPGDAAFMKSPTHQRELANAIADAAVEYLEHYERRIAGGSPKP